MEKREILAEAATKMAEADGIKDFDTKYDENINYDEELAGDKPNDLLMLASEDEKCVEAYKNMNTAKEAYDKALKEANPSITKVNENKKAMLEIKEKYEKEFKSQDTKTWSEAAAKEYNEAIKTYNESVKTASTQMAAVEAAKTSYHEARTTFENAEKSYYEEVKKQHEEDLAPSDDDSNNGDVGNGQRPGHGRFQRDRLAGHAGARQHHRHAYQYRKQVHHGFIPPVFIVLSG